MLARLSFKITVYKSAIITNDPFSHSQVHKAAPTWQPRPVAMRVILSMLLVTATVFKTVVVVSMPDNAHM